MSAIFSADAHALPPERLAELCENSALIVAGVPDARTKIDDQREAVTFKIATALKGDAQDEIFVLTHPGVVHRARFRTGYNTIAFLSDSGESFQGDTLYSVTWEEKGVWTPLEPDARDIQFLFAVLSVGTGDEQNQRQNRAGVYLGSILDSDDDRMTSFLAREFLRDREAFDARDENQVNEVAEAFLAREDAGETTCELASMLVDAVAEESQMVTALKPRLASLAASADNAGLRSAFVRCLKKLDPDADVAEALEAQLAGTDTEAARAILVIGLSRDADAAQIVASRLSSESAQVREAACIALALLRGSDYRGALLSVAVDQDANVRAASLLALTFAGDDADRSYARDQLVALPAGRVKDQLIDVLDHPWRASNYIPSWELPED
ncbi:MAG: HEAT repeat domain-containing protein [Planctomycetes bacterium]|nr:HEAT repeat domain-containing protein [Planctomycetota bacterium]